MEIRFYLDAAGHPHIHRHGVTEAEVTDVLESALEDGAGAEGARVAIGRAQAGRVLKVIYVPDPNGNGLFVITAYQMTPKALRALKRRLRKRS